MACMASDDDSGLPASIDAAWGRRARPTKGPRPALSLERIVEAAVAVATAEGLDAVSMGASRRSWAPPRCRSTATSRPRTSCSR